MVDSEPTFTENKFQKYSKGIRLWQESGCFALTKVRREVCITPLEKRLSIGQGYDNQGGA